MKEYIILLVESIEADIIRTKQEIGKVLEKVQVNVVKTKKEFVSQLKKHTPDLVITAYLLPSFDGIKALQLTREKSQYIPVIFLTDSQHEETAVECMKAGAADYITKNNISRLGNAVIAAIKASVSEETKIKTTDSLVSNAEVYHNMFAYNPQPMFVFDLDTLSILEANNSALDLYGYTREEFLALTLKDISPVEETTVVEKTPSTQSNLHNSGNWWHLKKNGEIMDVEITSHLIDFTGRKACNMQITDITKQKKAWEILISSEEKYRTLFENAQDVFFQTDLEGVLYEISPSVDRYLGFSREELIGNPINDLYYDIQDRDLLVKNLLENGKVADFVTRFKTRNNEITYASMNAHLIYNSKGQPDLIEGSLRDITERMLAVNITQKSEEKFRTLFENNSMVKLIVDIDTQQITDANYAASRFYGYSKENIKQMKIGEITTARPKK